MEEAFLYMQTFSQGQLLTCGNTIYTDGNDADKHSPKMSFCSLTDSTKLLLHIIFIMPWIYLITHD